MHQLPYLSSLNNIFCAVRMSLSPYRYEDLGHIPQTPMIPISLLSFPASLGHYSMFTTKRIKRYKTLCSILLDKKDLTVFTEATDKRFHWLRGRPWLDSVPPQFSETSSCTLAALCFCVQRLSLSFGQPSHLREILKTELCYSFSQKKRLG